MDSAKRFSVRRWLSAARHPTRRDGVIAAALLVLPWAFVWVRAPRHHLDANCGDQSGNGDHSAGYVVAYVGGRPQCQQAQPSG